MALNSVSDDDRSMIGSWLAPAYLGALLLLFLGERVLSSVDWARWLLSGAGAAGVVGCTAARFVGAARLQGEKRAVESILAKLSAGGVVACALYFATTDTGKGLLGIATASPETRARFDAAMTVAWVVLLLLSVTPALFGERAVAPMRAAERIEGRRVRAATLAGLTLAAAASYSALFVYGAGELDLKADFSYFRTARPSESTKNVAKSLTEEVKVTAFFPQLSEVGAEVEGYLKELAEGGGGKLSVAVHDRLLVPQLAKDARVTQDGTIVLTRSNGAGRETLNVGAEMKVAQAKLKSLDGDFQKALIKVLRSQRTAYLTVGHGEINESQTGDEGRTARTFRKILEAQGYSVKDLGMGQGLAADVPNDAHVVVVLGPTTMLMPEEISSLGRYFDRGGRVFVGLDPEAKIDLGALAEAFDLTWSPALLATDDARHFYPRRRNTSDRAVLVANRFSSHAAVSTLSKSAARAAVLMPGASSLDKRSGTDAKIDFAVKSFAEVWPDANGNFEFDEGSEKRGAQNLCAAVTRAPKSPPASEPANKDKAPDEARAFVCADVDAFSDAALLGIETNRVLALDAMRWLGGDESFIGQVSTAEDVRIEHTKQKDVVWFYGTIFGGPSIVLGLGLIASRRARAGSRRRAPWGSGSAGATSPSGGGRKTGGASGREKEVASASPQGERDRAGDNPKAESEDEKR